MSARVLPFGETALLVELADGDERRAYHAALAANPPQGVLETVPAARSVLVRLRSGSDLAAIAKTLMQVDLTASVEADEAPEPLVVPVHYDGADLAEVSRFLGISPAELIRRHVGQEWRVEFTGFAPGFGYLSGAEALDIPRRPAPRTRIPAGAVALAGSYTGIYPRPSPGGWQLIGRTEVEVWNPEADPPALLVPGRRVRFEELR